MTTMTGRIITDDHRGSGQDGDLKEKQVAAALQILFDLRQIVEW